MALRVLLADDHPIVRAGIAAMVSEVGMEIVDAVGDGRSAVARTLQLRPDIVVLDIAMPGLNGIEAARRIAEADASIGIIILSMYDCIEYMYRALQAGALGYVLKHSAAREIVGAIQTVACGRRYLSMELERCVEVERRLARPGARSPLDSLSSREREILQRVVEGQSSAEIAEILALSPKTVETYRSRLMQKLGVADVPALVKFAIQHGLTGPV